MIRWLWLAILMSLWKVNRRNFPDRHPNSSSCFEEVGRRYETTKQSSEAVLHLQHAFSLHTTYTRRDGHIRSGTEKHSQQISSLTCSPCPAHITSIAQSLHCNCAIANYMWRTVAGGETNRSCPTWGTTAMYKSDGKHHDGASIIHRKLEGAVVGCHTSEHHDPPMDQGKGRELEATYHYRWSEVFTYSIYSTVGRSNTRPNGPTQHTTILMCGKCAVDKHSV